MAERLRYPDPPVKESDGRGATVTEGMETLPPGAAASQRW